MKVTLDLHIHSERSFDGRMTVEEIAAAARAKGLDGVAICDHDVVYTGPTLCNGITIIPGVEFSTEHGHLLALFVDQPMGYTDWETTTAAVHELGGVTVLAHPFQHRRQAERLLPLLPGLDGIEVWNGRANRKDRQANALAAAFVQDHGLRPFGGSDAHLAREIGNGTLTVDAEDVSLPALRRALLSGTGTAAGRNGAARDVARSQYTKLKKTQAPLTRYGKWAVFAARCIWEDVWRGNWKEKKEKGHVTDR